MSYLHRGLPRESKQPERMIELSPNREEREGQVTWFGQHVPRMLGFVPGSSLARVRSMWQERGLGQVTAPSEG